MAEPLKRFDNFEPNDTILEAASVEMGKTISANIMDGSDIDFYRIQTGAIGGSVKIHLENRSDTLRPGIGAFNGNKSALGGNNDDTAGANLEHSFAAQARATYYLQVYGRSGSAGKYELTVTQE